MQIKLRTTNFNLTPAIDDYVSKKISHLEKFINPDGTVLSHEILCEVEIGKTTEHHKSGDIFRAEVNIKCPGMEQIYAVAEESDLYAAIDIVRDEAEREIISRKQKRWALLRKGGIRIKELLKRIKTYRR